MFSWFHSFYWIRGIAKLVGARQKCACSTVDSYWIEIKLFNAKFTPVNFLYLEAAFNNIQIIDPWVCFNYLHNILTLDLEKKKKEWYDSADGYSHYGNWVF